MDVLEHYKTKTLWRWLRSRGYQNELAGIEAIAATQDTEILKALCGVFGIEADQQMIQETPKNRQRMQENEALKAELKACKEQLQVLQATPPVSTPNFGDYFKSYNALKEKFFNAQDFESGKAILEELNQNYTELFEMDRYNIITPLRTKVRSQGDKPSLERIFWLCLLVHFWGFKWKSKPDGYDACQHFQPDFQDIMHFTQPERLMIPRKGKVHVFEKVVCASGAYNWIISPYDLKVGRVIRYKSYGFLSRFSDEPKAYGDNIMLFENKYHHGGHCYLLEGAVKIKRSQGDSREKEIPLFYKEIEL
ncbi:hypothetical protein [Helicobacter salomonis]|uniref:hypothetical protein n=1 Tax=Helicobacter salomonis TaxID=56878 RepID=UPI0013156ED0|nr:hypothetical protein [Helicobacter salomonis]